MGCDMQVTLIDSNAEDILYAFLVAEGQRYSSSNEKVPEVQFLQCQFFHVGLKDAASGLVECLEAIEEELEAMVYACSDGDIIIKSNVRSAEALDVIKDTIIEKYGAQIKNYMSEDEFFITYDLIDGRNKLKSECSKKLKKSSKQAQQLAKYFQDINLIATLTKTVQLTQMQKNFRTKPHVLIVEDQIFSQKMLKTILKDYTCYVAASAGEALMLYIEKCPDIVFLDIELPDLSGHNFAKLVNEIDPNPFVVIVTANHYEKDIQAAKENRVKGFIAKPYNKKAIIDVMDQFMKKRGKRATG
jgi:CheY-like chemotaxis protein